MKGKSVKIQSVFVTCLILMFMLVSMPYEAFASNISKPVPVEVKNPLPEYQTMVDGIENTPVSISPRGSQFALSAVDAFTTTDATAINIVETEPNDEFHQANIVTSDLNINTDYMMIGQIDYTYDVDLFQFTVNKSGYCLIVGAWVGEYFGYNWEDDLGIGIWDSNQDLVNSAFLYTDIDGSTYQVMETFLTPGTYYVGILETSDYYDLYTGEVYSALISFENSSIPVTGISLNTMSLNINGIGVTEKLVETIYPVDATNKNVMWSSDNPSVATVDSYGNVTSWGYGSATITAVTEDGGIAAYCDVTVQTQKDYSGIYTIMSKNSGLVMDVFNGGTTEGTNIIQYSFHGMANQQWKFDSLNNGYYKITSVLNPTYSIDVYGGGTTIGNRVIQYHYHGGTNQQWKVIDNGDGSISLMSRLSVENGTRYLLDVYGGGKTEGVNVIQYPGNGGDNQKWYLKTVATYNVIFNTNGGSPVDSTTGASGSTIKEPINPTKEGMVIAGWYKDEALTLPWNFSSDRILWDDINLYAKWVKDYRGTFVIRSKNSNLVMDVYGGGTTEGTNIIQYSYHGMTNQQWKFESLNNGYYKITSVLNPAYSIDVYGGGTDIGNRVIQYHYHGGINQQWKILENGDGSISLMSRLAEESGTGYLLDVYGGGKTEGVNVIQWSSNNGDNQKWYLENIY